eukprot:gene3021-3479_t
MSEEKNVTGKQQTDQHKDDEHSVRLTASEKHHGAAGHEEEDILIEQEGLETSIYGDEPGEKLYLVEKEMADDDDDNDGNKHCPHINRAYLVPKGFFFFFYASNGTLMPYLTLFFKQLGLTAGQVGVVAGMKPYIAFIFIPIWGYIADKTKKAKWIYTLAMITFAAGYFVFSLAPADHVCKTRSNSTQHRVDNSMAHGHHRRRSGVPFNGNSSLRNENSMARRNNNNNPWIIDIATGDQQSEANFKAIDDVHVDINSIFTFLLLVSIIKTVFSCPALTIVDTVTVEMLKANGESHRYGMQRLWGSIGWGLTAFGVGAIISTLPLCPGKNDEVSYYPAFYIFTGLMLVAFVIGLRLDFDEKHKERERDKTNKSAGVWQGLKLLKKPHFFYFLFTAFYVGVAMAVIRTFLFWHLKDLGGTQLLFSIISAVNCTAEVIMYFLSAWFIKTIGHIKVLYLGLLCYAIRLFFYAFVENPWFVLLVEPLSGITTAAVWAAMASYVGVNSVAESATTVQGILHGVHWGLGHGCGELAGGFLINAIGAKYTFGIFALISVADLVLFILVNALHDNCCPNDDNKDNLAYSPLSQKPCCQNS